MVFVGCRQRQNADSEVKDINVGLADLLNFDRLSEYGKRSICSRRILMTFFMNAEQGPQLVADTTRPDGFTAEDVKKIAARQKLKDDYYFNLGKEAQAKLVERTGHIQKECLSNAFSPPNNPQQSTGSISLATIIDGPGFEDSRIELNQWLFQGAGNSGQWTKTINASAYRYDGIAKRFEAGEKPFEIFWPSDMFDISNEIEQEFLRQENKAQKTDYKTFDFAMRILKGHGFTVRPKVNRVSLPFLMMVQPTDTAKPSELNSVQFFDLHHHFGAVALEASSYMIPTWSPQQYCAYFAKKSNGETQPTIYQSCIAEQQLRIDAPFDGRTIDGCTTSQLPDFAQGDRKQGDGKQGDSKQGGSSLTFLQGLTGIDAEVGLTQGGKGSSFPREQLPQTSAVARLALGQGLALFPAVESRYLADYAKANDHIRFSSVSDNEMTVFDTCTSNFVSEQMPPWHFGPHTPKADWAGTGLVLYSPFSLGADAIDFQVLSTHQYLLLKTYASLEGGSRDTAFEDRQLAIKESLERGGIDGLDQSCKVFGEVYRCHKIADCTWHDLGESLWRRVGDYRPRAVPGVAAQRKANAILALNIVRQLNRFQDYSLVNLRDVVLYNGDIFRQHLARVSDRLADIAKSDWGQNRTNSLARLYDSVTTHTILAKLFPLIEKNLLYGIPLLKEQGPQSLALEMPLYLQTAILTAPFKPQPKDFRFEEDKNLTYPIAALYETHANTLKNEPYGAYKKRIEDLIPIERELMDAVLSQDSTSDSKIPALRERYYQLILAPIE